jgi:hypothetical protein
MLAKSDPPKSNPPNRRGDWADIVRNECGTVVRGVLAAELRKTFDEMELALDLATEICPHCGGANLFPGFSEMLTYTCKQCGKLVRLSDDPEVDRLFGPPDD